MTKVNMEWAREQLTRAKKRRAVGDSVVQLLEVWETLKHRDEVSEDVIDTFKHLATGHPIFIEETLNLTGEWIPVQPGQIKLTDIVRVHSDAYTGDIGILHNGRIGRVVGLRSGNVIVKSIDNKPPDIDGAHHSPHVLDKLVE